MFSFKPKAIERIQPIGENPGRIARWRAWVVLQDGRSAYIDHYKQDGRFGVRPVQMDSEKHYPNPSPHWSEADRIRYPEELSLAVGEFRAATMDEIPRGFRT